MYIIDRLRFIQLGQNNQATDFQLANFFLNHLNELEELTQKQCIDLIGVSKSSLQRFYSEGGFESFESFIHELNREYLNSLALSKNFYSVNRYEKMKINIGEFMLNNDLNLSQLEKLSKNIKQANKILFYGNFKQIYRLESLISKLTLMKKDITFLFYWDIDINNQLIKQLEANDLLIIIDIHISLNTFLEQTIYRPGLLNIHQLNKKCNKYFIGQGLPQSGINMITLQHHKSPYVYANQMTFIDFLLTSLL